VKTVKRAITCDGCGDVLGYVFLKFSKFGKVIHLPSLCPKCVKVRSLVSQAKKEVQSL
jgi:hypothetical protein